MARSAGVVLVKELIFLNEPPRRFAAPRLNQGGELLLLRLFVQNPSSSPEEGNFLITRFQSDPLTSRHYDVLV